MIYLFLQTFPPVYRKSLTSLSYLSDLRYDKYAPRFIGTYLTCGGGGGGLENTTCGSVIDEGSRDRGRNAATGRVSETMLEKGFERNIPSFREN